MGIDQHGLVLLRFAARHGRFGRVATIGRQQLGLDRAELCSLTGSTGGNGDNDYCENLLLRHFGAASVDSWDYSNYEGATQIADMNKPLDRELGAYDTVLDAGSLEHVYNVPQAFRNVSELCREGGQILHVSPTNNYCGHGFWQVSPELFFSLYSDSNGYSGTRVFLANTYRTDVWWEVKKPQNGQRVNILSFTPTLVMCRTVKARRCPEPSVQQSDYVHVWGQEAVTPVLRESRPKWRIWTASALQRSALVDYAYFLYIKTSGRLSLSSRNPHLKEVPVSTLS